MFTKQRNMKIKKFLCALLVAAMASPLVSFVAASTANGRTQDDLLSLSLALDTIANSSELNTQAITARFDVDSSKGSATEILQESMVLNLDTSLSDKGNGFVECFVEGKLINGRDSHSISANGYLKSVVNASNAEVLIGGITGFLDNVQTPENMITLTICLDVKTGEAYVPVAIGAYVDEENLATLLEFGTYFPSLDESVRTMLAERALESKTFSDDIANIQAVRPSFNANEIGLASQTGSLGGRNVIFGSHYGNRDAIPTGMFTARVRAQVHLNNFIASYNATLPAFDPNRPWQSFTSTEHLVDTVWIIFNTNNNNVTLQNNAFPGAGEDVLTFSAAMATPWGLLNAGMELFEFNISLSGVRHSITNSERSIETRIWNNLHGLNSTVVTSLASPLNTNTGVASRYYMHNRMNLNNSAATTSYVAAQVFLNEITVGGQFIPRWVPISSQLMTAIINSRNP